MSSHSVLRLPLLQFAYLLGLVSDDLLRHLLQLGVLAVRVDPGHPRKRDQSEQFSGAVERGRPVAQPAEYTRGKQTACYAQ